MIDAYTHCGVTKYLPVAAVTRAMDAAGVDRAVLCQHLGEYDNAYLESVVSAQPDRFTAVALVDGDDDGWRESLAAVAASGVFRGLRVVDDTMARNPALAEEAASAGLVIVVYAPAGIARALAPVRRLLAACPDATVEITHLGCPQLEGGELASGLELLELAREPGVVVTLSGLSMFCEAPHAPLGSLIAATLEEFGASRLLWGSNFPVCGVDDESYRRELELILAGGWGIGRSAAQLITSENAKRVWFNGEAA
jgi:predicted TIM-barrel fold metal-dependent hydrolase